MGLGREFPKPMGRGPPSKSPLSHLSFRYVLGCMQGAPREGRANLESVNTPGAEGLLCRPFARSRPLVRSRSL